MKYVKMFLKESRYSGVYASTFPTILLSYSQRSVSGKVEIYFQCIRGLYHSYQIRHRRRYGQGDSPFEKYCSSVGLYLALFLFCLCIFKMS